ncbi:kelch-like protein 12 [Oculina patagonica]
MASPYQPMSADPSQHRHELIERLDILRTNQSFCDVTVAVKDKEFKAHKVVLAAASPFIRSLLASDMRESKEELIKIKLEEATASVMEAVLQYVYTGNVSVTAEIAHDLIATADYLLLPGLKTMACNFLKKKVTIENCVFNYYFAEKYRCVKLGKKLVSFQKKTHGKAWHDHRTQHGVQCQNVVYIVDKDESAESLD